MKQVLADLVAGGLLTSTAGPRGGYRLARPLEELTLLEVIESAEDYFTLDHCVLRGGPCDWKGACPIHETWSTALTAFASSLATASPAELARRDHDIEQCNNVGVDSTHIEPTPRRGSRI